MGLIDFIKDKMEEKKERARKEKEIKKIQDQAEYETRKTQAEQIGKAKAEIKHEKELEALKKTPTTFYEKTQNMGDKANKFVDFVLGPPPKKKGNDRPRKTKSLQQHMDEHMRGMI